MVTNEGSDIWAISIKVLKKSGDEETTFIFLALLTCSEIFVLGETVIVSLIPYNKLRLKDYMLHKGERISDDLMSNYTWVICLHFATKWMKTQRHGKTGKRCKW